MENETAQRKRDFGCYLKGKEPSSLELQNAPTLENWSTAIGHSGRAEDHLSLLMVLQGSVSGHPSLPDGHVIHTSQVIWFDRNQKWARTWNRLYRLGARTRG
jgi:hypothetical protein